MSKKKDKLNKIDLLPKGWCLLSIYASESRILKNGCMRYKLSLLLEKKKK